MACPKPITVVGIKSPKTKGVKYTRVVSEHKADVRYPVVSAEA